MSPNLWVEVNIHHLTGTNPYHEARNVILGFVKPFVDTHRRQKKSWHYFHEQCPPNGLRPGEPEIRLRFYGNQTNIGAITTDLNIQLTQLAQTRQHSITHFHFGNHGGPGQYNGERDYWGRDWKIAMRQYKNSAEWSLYFLSKYPLQHNPDIPIGRHGHRYAHLLLNQMTVPHTYTSGYNLTIQE